MEAPRLHPDDPLKRARNRAWTDYIPEFARTLGGIYRSRSASELEQVMTRVPGCLQKLETALKVERGSAGPFFNGDAFSMFLQRFHLIESKWQSGLLRDFPLVNAWCEALLTHAFVNGSVVEDFEARFKANLGRLGSHVATLIYDDT